MKKAKRQMVAEVLEQGTVIFERVSPYVNGITGRQCIEHLRHVQYQYGEYGDQVWDITFINNRLHEAFVLKQ